MASKSATLERPTNGAGGHDGPGTVTAIAATPEPGKPPAGERTINYDVPPPDIRDVYITVQGTAQLVCHRWSDKAKKMILDAQTGKANAGKEPKNPQRDYEESLYVHPEGGYGFKAIAFKAGMVRAGTYLDMTMTYLRGAFHIVGSGPEGLVRIEGQPEMREDMVRVGRGVADIRYRGAFWPWRVVLHVRYNARAISAEQLLNLAQHAGFSVGVGEGRPEKDGEWGTYEVVQRPISEGAEA